MDLLARGKHRACVPCKKAKKACDGSTPCSRCGRLNKECVYPAARSSRKGRHQADESEDREPSPHHTISPYPLPDVPRPHLAPRPTMQPAYGSFPMPPPAPPPSESIPSSSMDIVGIAPTPFHQRASSMALTNRSQTTSYLEDPTSELINELIPVSPLSPPSSAALKTQPQPQPQPQTFVSPPPPPPPAFTSFLPETFERLSASSFPDFDWTTSFAPQPFSPPPNPSLIDSFFRESISDVGPDPFLLFSRLSPGVALRRDSDVSSAIGFGSSSTSNNNNNSNFPGTAPMDQSDNQLSFRLSEASRTCSPVDPLLYLEFGPSSTGVTPTHTAAAGSSSSATSTQPNVVTAPTTAALPPPPPSVPEKQQLQPKDIQPTPPPQPQPPTARQSQPQTSSEQQHSTQLAPSTVTPPPTWPFSSPTTSTVSISPPTGSPGVDAGAVVEAGGSAVVPVVTPDTESFQLFDHLLKSIFKASESPRQLAQGMITVLDLYRRMARMAHETLYLKLHGSEQNAVVPREQLLESWNIIHPDGSLGSAAPQVLEAIAEISKTLPDCGLYVKDLMNQEVVHANQKLAHLIGLPLGENARSEMSEEFKNPLRFIHPLSLSEVQARVAQVLANPSVRKFEVKNVVYMKRDGSLFNANQVTVLVRDSAGWVRFVITGTQESTLN